MEYQIDLAFQKQIAGEADACLPDRQVDALLLVMRRRVPGCTGGDWARRARRSVCGRRTNP